LDPVTIQQAAKMLGIAPNTVRRRIKLGELSAHKVPTAQGYEWRVHLPTAGDQLPTNGEQVPTTGSDLPPSPVELDVPIAPRVVQGGSPLEPAPPSDAVALRALEMVEQLQQRNLELAGQVGFLQARLQEREDQIRLLTMEHGEPRTVEQEPSPTPVPQKRSWWRQFLGRRGT
jgi:excisionase family DNA binding protein